MLKNVPGIPSKLFDPFICASLTAGILQNRILSKKLDLGRFGKNVGVQKRRLEKLTSRSQFGVQRTPH